METAIGDYIGLCRRYKLPLGWFPNIYFGNIIQKYYKQKCKINPKQSNHAKRKHK